MIKISCTKSSTRIPTVKHNFMNRERKRKSNILDKIQSFLIKEILSFIISAPFANERRQILNNFSCSFISNSTPEWRFFSPVREDFQNIRRINSTKNFSERLPGTLGAKFFNNSPKPHWNVLLNAWNYFKLSIFTFMVIFAENSFASRVIYGESSVCHEIVVQRWAKVLRKTNFLRLLNFCKFNFQFHNKFTFTSFVKFSKQEAVLWNVGDGESPEYTRDETLVSFYFNYEKINIKL